jgi:branched-subunit amino acid transport protein
MRYAPGAALVALISPELFTVGSNVAADSLDPLQNPKLLVAIVTGVLFFYTRNMLLMITSGMLLFALLRCFPFA